jgi:DNA mismatch repair protein MutS
VDRANEVLGQLSVSHIAAEVAKPQADTDIPKRTADRKGAQLSLFTEYLDHPVIDDLRKLDINRLSPIEAFERLRKLAERAKNGSGS